MVILAVVLCAIALVINYKSQKSLERTMLMLQGMGDKLINLSQPKTGPIAEFNNMSVITEEKQLSLKNAFDEISATFSIDPEIYYLAINKAKPYPNMSDSAAMVIIMNHYLNDGWSETEFELPTELEIVLGTDYKNTSDELPKLIVYQGYYGTYQIWKAFNRSTGSFTEEIDPPKCWKYVDPFNVELG